LLKFPERNQKALLCQLLGNGGTEARQQHAVNQCNETSMQILEGLRRSSLSRRHPKRNLTVVYALQAPDLILFLLGGLKEEKR
jgi:hypothetical protein